MSKIKQFLKYNSWVMLLDIVAINAACYLALCLRFNFNFIYSSNISHYLNYYYRFAPYYTGICIVVFFLFKLYKGLWTYAGLNDMNRIIGANAITACTQVVQTLLFVGRMPISFYVICAFLQFLFTVIIRFSGRFYRMEKKRHERRKRMTIPAMVIGSGDLGKRVVHHLENNTVYRAEVIAGKDSGWLMDGIRVVPLDSIEDEIKSKKIKTIFVADKRLSKEERDNIFRIAGNSENGGIELNDLTGYMSNQSGFLPLTNLLEVTQMPIMIEIDGEEKKFESVEECLSELSGEYEVLKVNATRFVLRKKEQDTNWMKVYQEQTREEISFF